MTKLSNTVSGMMPSKLDTARQTGTGPDKNTLVCEFCINKSGISHQKNFLQPLNSIEEKHGKERGVISLLQLDRYLPLDILKKLEVTMTQLVSMAKQYQGMPVAQNIEKLSSSLKQLMDLFPTLMKIFVVNLNEKLFVENIGIWKRTGIFSSLPSPLHYLAIMIVTWELLMKSSQLQLPKLAMSYNRIAGNVLILAVRYVHQMIGKEKHVFESEEEIQKPIETSRRITNANSNNSCNSFKSEDNLSNIISQLIDHLKGTSWFAVATTELLVYIVSQLNEEIKKDIKDFLMRIEQKELFKQIENDLKYVYDKLSEDYFKSVNPNKSKL